MFFPAPSPSIPTPLAIIRYPLGNVVYIEHQFYVNCFCSLLTSVLEHDLAVRTVFYAMLDEFYDSGGYSCRYIPLLKPGTSRSCVVNPLRWTNAVSLEKKNKKLQQEFIRRLCKKEKYILEPIGPKPKIEPKRISGNQTG